MATVRVSENVRNARSKAKAEHLADAWEKELTTLGSRGEFTISHGNDKESPEVEGKPFDEGLWIATAPNKCRVFVNRNGKPDHYVGAASPSDASHLYQPRCCTCGGGH